MTDMYFSIDIETDGDAPGCSSMLSIGVVALHPVTQSHYASFYRTLKRLPDARPQTTTMEWWDQFPKQYAEAREDAVEPKKAMEDLRTFVEDCLAPFRGKPLPTDPKDPVAVFVASPASFDFSFVSYYLHRFLGESCFGFRALDLKSYAMALIGCSFSEAKKERYFDEWKTTLPHTHNALEDAEQQADVFRRMLVWRAKMQLRLRYPEGDG